MGHKKIRRIEGFILVEILSAGLILAIVALGVLGVIAVQKALLNRALHRVEAMNYATSAAEHLMEQARVAPAKLGDYAKADGTVWKIGQQPPACLTGGEHKNPEICSLPGGYFKDILKGEISYAVSEIMVDNLSMIKIEIRVSWQEPMPKAARCVETLIFGI